MHLLFRLCTVHWVPAVSFALVCVVQSCIGVWARWHCDAPHNDSCRAMIFCLTRSLGNLPVSPHCAQFATPYFGNGGWEAILSLVTAECSTPLLHAAYVLSCVSL